MTKLTWGPCRDQNGRDTFCTRLGDTVVVIDLVRHPGRPGGEWGVFGVNIFPRAAFGTGTWSGDYIVWEIAGAADWVSAPVYVHSWEEAVAMVEPKVLEYVRQEVDRLEGQLTALKTLIAQPGL